GLRHPGRAAIGGAPEAQLLAGRLEARPGDINVVAVLAPGIGSYRHPVLVPAVVLLDDHGVAPGAAAVGGTIYLNGSTRARIRAEARVVEGAVAVHGDHRVAERGDAAGHGRHEAAGPRQPAVVRRREPREEAPQENRSEEHTSELQSRFDLVCRLLLEKKKKKKKKKQRKQAKVQNK